MRTEQTLADAGHVADPRGYPCAHGTDSVRLRIADLKGGLPLCARNRLRCRKVSIDICRATPVRTEQTLRDLGI